MATVITTTPDDQNSSDEKPGIAVVMVPFLAQGHLNQLLQLSCIISSYSIPVFYVGPALHNRQAKHRVNGLNLAGIRFIDLPTPPFPTPPPDPTSPEKFPTQLHPSWLASLTLRQPFSDFLKHTSEKFERVAVVHDPMMSFVVQDVKSVSNAESYVFNCISAYSNLSIIRHNLPENEVSVEFPKGLPSFDGCVPHEVQSFVALQSEPIKCISGSLYNTCRAIEGDYVNILEKEEIAGNRKTWAVGPILPTTTTTTSSSSFGNNRDKCLEWLDKHEPNSVVYVSFGTTVSLHDEQIREIALGLEHSKVKFLWVLRDADKGDVFDGKTRRAELPEGFEGRVEGVGLVVRDWAPQPQILAHGSIGGFVSHCGWNSCVESLTTGVPIEAWPMHSDQPANTVLITEVLGVGIVVRGWEEDRAELVRASRVERVVRRLMESEEGDRVRKMAAEVGDVVRGAAREGGVSRVEMDSFIAHIKRS